MKNSHIRNTKLNISATLISQIITSLCNFLLSGIILNTFGSMLYGITTSINQFLSYVSLLEGGIGRVGRAEMYKPLAENNYYGVSRVYHALKRFFFGVGIISGAYILLLSLTYYDLADIEQYSRKYIFALVWILGFTTLSKYLGGITNLSLLVADQKQYVANVIIAVTTVLSVVMAIIFVQLRANLLYVKLICSVAYIARPVVYSIYVKKYYRLPNVGKDYSQLEQKWSGIGQNIALFLHTNTDIVLLTLLADIRMVAIYSVYSLVISNIRLIAITFTSGMEGALGEIYASGEQALLRKTYQKYQFLMFCVVFVLFGTTAVMILPFVELFTENVADVHYVQPIFALVFLLAEASECVMHPCCTLAVSTNQIKGTKWAYYWEVILNLTISIVLIQWNPLLGLILATFIAVTIKNIIFIVFASKKILKANIAAMIKPLLLISLEIIITMKFGVELWHADIIQNYLQWVMYAVVAVIGLIVAAIAVVFLFYNKSVKQYFEKNVQKNSDY